VGDSWRWSVRFGKDGGGSGKGDGGSGEGRDPLGNVVEDMVKVGGQGGSGKGGGESGEGRGGCGEVGGGHSEGH
jgi:hypothetical protein